MTVFVVEYEVDYEEAFGGMFYYWTLDKIFKTRESAEKYLVKNGGLDRRIVEVTVFE